MNPSGLAEMTPLEPKTTTQTRVASKCRLILNGPSGTEVEFANQIRFRTAHGRGRPDGAPFLAQQERRMTS
jgi:hypothetical protein